MHSSPMTAPSGPETAPAFDAIRYERGWRLAGARLDQALVRYRAHREACDVCPDLVSNAANFLTDQLCQEGLELCSTAKALQSEFTSIVTSQAHGTFLGLTSGQVALMLPDSASEVVTDPDTQEPVNWLHEPARDRAFQVMLKYVAWGYDRVDEPSWSGEANWAHIKRTLGFDTLSESAIEHNQPWSLKEAQLLYELAFHLHCEALEMRDELDKNAVAAHVVRAVSQDLQKGGTAAPALISMIRRRDPALFEFLDRNEPSDALKVGKLTGHFQNRIWWVLNSVEFIRPETAPYAALAEG